MKSFNNWIFIELKEFVGECRRRRLFVIICFADASKRPVKYSNPSESDSAINSFANAKLFHRLASFPFRSPPPPSNVSAAIGRYAEWVSFAAESEIADQLLWENDDRCAEENEKMQSSMKWTPCIGSEV